MYNKNGWHIYVGRFYLHEFEIYLFDILQSFLCRRIGRIY